VAGGEGRLGVDDRREGLGDAIQPRVVGALDAASSSRSIERAMFAPRSQRMAPSWRAPSTPMATSARRWRARVRSGAPGAIVRLR